MLVFLTFEEKMLLYTFPCFIEKCHLVAMPADIKCSWLYLTCSNG